MARIRTIKPEFWSNEQVMDCSPMARLLFIGLWNFCDDAGNHPASAKTIKAEIFPSDDITSSDVQLLLDELSTNGLIALYSASDKDFWHVTGWRHQKIDKPTMKYPPYPDEESKQPPLPFDEASPPEGKGKGREGKGKGKEWKGEQQAGGESTLLGRICIGLRQVGVQANPHHPQVQEIVRQGLSVETVIAAAEEAVRSKPNERIGIGLVIAILDSWAKKAANMNVAGARPPPQSQASSRDAARAAAANSIGLGVPSHDAQPPTFDATTGQPID